MARLKTVFDTDRIGHVWIHGPQQYARNKGHNFYFDGDTIYSYGRHFPIARKCDHKGKTYIFFTTRTYSVTTSKHIGQARYASRHLPTFCVADVMASPANQIENFKRRIADQIHEVGSARNKVSRAKRYAVLLSIQSDARAFAKFFGFRNQFNLPETMEAIAEQAKTINAKQDRQRRATARKLNEQHAARVAKYRAELPERIASWRLTGSADDRYYMHGSYGLECPVCLRVNGDVIESSRGVEFPVSHAMRLLPMIEKLYAATIIEPIEPESLRLGHYKIDRIESNGDIVAGCHLIKRNEIERLIAELSDVVSVSSN